MPRAKDHFLGRHYEAEHVTRPFKPLNPTRRYLVARNKAVDGPNTHKVEQQTLAAEHHPRAAYIWSSRNNRKGRHALALGFHPSEHEATKRLKTTNTWSQSLRGIAKMFLRYPIWDVSYDVAVIFTIGSIIWVINGFYSWLPALNPSTHFSDWDGGLTAFIGATVFEVGSVLLMLEAVNENCSDCFGWAVEDSLDGFFHLKYDYHCNHPQAQKRTFFKGALANEKRSERIWYWWPTWYELTTHYVYDMGFLACSAQMFGATVFWISGFTALPPILNKLSTAAQNGAYWLPQVIGGLGFCVSSLLFMLEVQPRWYIPAPRVLGWHIGLWNFIGAIGFTLCGALGFGIRKPGVNYALTLSTFIGSWAFLIGSVIQWFESLNKYSIQVDKKVATIVERTFDEEKSSEPQNTTANNT